MIIEICEQNMSVVETKMITCRSSSFSFLCIESIFFRLDDKSFSRLMLCLIEGKFLEWKQTSPGRRTFNWKEKFIDSRTSFRYESHFSYWAKNSISRREKSVIGGEICLPEYLRISSNCLPFADRDFERCTRENEAELPSSQEEFLLEKKKKNEK